MGGCPTSRLDNSVVVLLLDLGTNSPGITLAKLLTNKARPSPYTGLGGQRCFFLLCLTNLATSPEYLRCHVQTEGPLTSSSTSPHSIIMFTPPTSHYKATPLSPGCSCLRRIWQLWTVAIWTIYPLRDRPSVFHGVSDQPAQIAVRTPRPIPVIRHPVAPPDGLLAGLPGHTQQNYCIRHDVPVHRVSHSLTVRSSGGPDKLCLPGPCGCNHSLSLGVPPCDTSGQRCATSNPSTPPTGTRNLVDTQPLALCARVSSHSARCFL